MNHKLLICIFSLLFSYNAFANSYIEKNIPQAQKVGEGTLSLVFWDIYKAELYSPHGKYNPIEPHSISIKYFVSIKGSDIAERSIDEIRGQGFDNQVKLDEWLKEMVRIFPNVEDGTVLTAIFIPDRETIFHMNGKEIGAINDPLFTKYFADIWLGEKTTEQGLREDLLGL